MIYPRERHSARRHLAHNRMILLGPSIVLLEHLLDPYGLTSTKPISCIRGFAVFSRLQAKSADYPERERTLKESKHRSFPCSQSTKGPTYVYVMRAIFCACANDRFPIEYIWTNRVDEDDRLLG